MKRNIDPFFSIRMSGGLSLKSQVRLDPKWSGTDIGKHRIYFFSFSVRYTDKYNNCPLIIILFPNSEKLKP